MKKKFFHGESFFVNQTKNTVSFHTNSLSKKLNLDEAKYFKYHILQLIVSKNDL